MPLSRIQIKEEMSKQGIRTLTELATRMGITKNQLSVMLSDSFIPIKSNVIKLCDTLGVSPAAIIDFGIQSPTKDIINSEKNKNDITCIELFAGAGGLALGFEEAGINDICLVEFDKTCCETLKRNRADWNVICDDIHNVDFSQYENKVDIVSGGFPCQAFSYAGKKLGFDDTRGTLFHEFARCIKETHPKMFLAENVKGLESHDHGRTLKTILNVFESLGYNIEYRILNAAYFGVGQKRERIVIIGIRADLPIHFEFPEPEKKMRTLREALKDCPKSVGIEYSPKKKKILEMVPQGGCWVDLPENVAKEYMGKSYYSGGGRRGMARRISWDEPCLTLTCSPSQKQTERCHPTETRPFTVREYARIQSFPDNWEFSGGINDQYKQIGNAVPVEMAKRIAIQIKKALLEYKKLYS